MEFKVRRKGKYKRTEKFMTKMKKIQKTKAVLEKVQKKMKKYANRKREKVNEYKTENLVMFSTKDLKYQMIEKRTKKLMKRFIGPYKIKKIVLQLN